MGCRYGTSGTGGAQHRLHGGSHLPACGVDDDATVWFVPSTVTLPTEHLALCITHWPAGEGVLSQLRWGHPHTVALLCRAVRPVQPAGSGYCALVRTLGTRSTEAAVATAYRLQAALPGIPGRLALPARPRPHHLHAGGQEDCGHQVAREARRGAGAG